MMPCQYNAMSRILTVAGVLLSTVALGVPRAGAAQALSVTEWLVPWPESRPRDPYVDATGLVWFVGQRSDYLASFAEDGERFKRFDLPPGTGPHNLIVDEGGQVWFAGNRVAYIGRLDPVTGDIAEYPMPETKAGDPHTLVFEAWAGIRHCIVTPFRQLDSIQRAEDSFLQVQPNVGRAT